jgi:hypothetical protein
METVAVLSGAPEKRLVVRAGQSKALQPTTLPECKKLGA